MKWNDRQIIESPLYIGEDERKTYNLTTTPWGGGSTTPTATVKLEADLTDVTATIMPSGSASGVGDVITLPQIRSLTTGVRYRLEVSWFRGSDREEAWAVLIGQE